MSGKRRLDAEMVCRGLAGGRDAAKRLIQGGFVLVDGYPAQKPSAPVSGDDSIICTFSSPYVGRGGEKLAKVLRECPLSVSGKVCVDVGASTGGFCDCLLQNGAAHIYAVDVGHDQLHPKLRSDGRVTCMEGVDIRDTETITRVIPPHSADVCTVDVSFISVTKIFDDLPPLLCPSGEVVCLIKPQFEAGRTGISKKGIVKDPKIHSAVLSSLMDFWNRRGWFAQYLDYSPIAGGDGNREYLVVLAQAPARDPDIEGTVGRAMAALSEAGKGN